jgi:hypothetical protein
MELKRTITSIFIVPTLGINRDSLRENSFLNGYVEDDSKDVQYSKCVYLLFRPTDLDKFRAFLNKEYERTKTIIDDYDYEGGFVIVVYKLNDKFKTDYGLVKLGRYSKTSKEFQALFPKIVKVQTGSVKKEEISLQYRIFNKTEDLRVYWSELLDIDFDETMEVWQGWIEEKEILNINQLKEQNV